jgi:hypothetical protein
MALTPRDFFSATRDSFESNGRAPCFGARRLLLCPRPAACGERAARTLDNERWVRGIFDRGAHPPRLSAFADYCAVPSPQTCLRITDAVARGVVASERGAWLATSPTGQTISALVSADASADPAQGVCYNDTGVEVRACRRAPRNVEAHEEHAGYPGDPAGNPRCCSRMASRG